MTRPLTEKQQVFVKEYARTQDAVHAARMAGVKHPGKHAHRMLRSAAVKEAVERGLKGPGRLGLEADNALETLYDLMANATTDAVRLRAAQEILDRAGAVQGAGKEGAGARGRGCTLVDYSDPAAVAARISQLRERLGQMEAAKGDDSCGDG